MSIQEQRETVLYQLGDRVNVRGCLLPMVNCEIVSRKIKGNIIQYDVQFNDEVFTILQSKIIGLYKKEFTVKDLHALYKKETGIDVNLPKDIDDIFLYPEWLQRKCIALLNKEMK